MSRKKKNPRIVLLGFFFCVRFRTNYLRLLEDDLVPVRPPRDIILLPFFEALDLPDLLRVLVAIVMLTKINL